MEIAIADGLCKRKNASVIGEGGTIGVDLNIFNINKRELYKAEILKKYPVLSGRTVYGYLGRIDVDKGINELLKAFWEMDNPNTALMLIGPFDAVRSGLDDKLIEKAKSCENIIFVGFTRDVPLYLSAVDILVHPTYREGFSMVIQQAMAMGCAVITTNIPGPSEVIIENKCGRLVAPKNSVALRKEMEKLHGDAKMRKTFVANGLIRVKEKFERNHMLELTYEDRCKMMKNANVLE